MILFELFQKIKKNNKTTNAGQYCGPARYGRRRQRRGLCPPSLPRGCCVIHRSHDIRGHRPRTENGGACGSKLLQNKLPMSTAKVAWRPPANQTMTPSMYVSDACREEKNVQTKIVNVGVLGQQRSE